MSPAPDFADWPFVFVVPEDVPDAEAEQLFWKRWLEQWNPRQEWMQ